MNNGVYSKKFHVRSYEVNSHQEATIVSILNYFQETATCHSAYTGFDTTKLLENNYGWVVTHWCIEVEKYPVCNEEIIVSTWAYSFNKFYATREYSIHDSKGKIIAKATSLWIFMDIQKRRPIRIPNEVLNSYEINNERELEHDFHKLDNEKFSCIDKKEFYIRRSDIDTNGHVNNTKYADWILETIPESIYNEYRLGYFEIIYKKETTYGAKIISDCRESEKDENSFEFRSCISSENMDFSFAESKTIWYKR